MTIVLILLVITVVLFATEFFPVDVTALLLLTALLLFGLLTPKEAFAGFGNDTIITLAGLFVLTRSLLRTGVIELVGGFLSRLSKNTTVTVRLMLTGIGLVSAFTSNTATTAVFLPVMLGLARRVNINPGKILMPLAHASILGGTMTVIGTSTNLVVSGLLPRYDLEPLGFFELAWVGVPITVLGLAYLFFVAPRLLPARASDLQGGQVRRYVADVLLDETSPLVGKTLRETGLGRDYGLTVVAVGRSGQTLPAPNADFRIEAGDKLVVEGHTDRLIAAKATLGVQLKAERKLLESLEGDEQNAVRLVEVVVMPRSPLLGRTLREAKFRERYGLSVLGLHRRARHEERLSRTRFQVGDVLLVQGTNERLGNLGDHLTVLADVSEHQRDTRKAPLALLAFLGALLLGATGLVPLAVAVVAAVALLLVTRVLTPEEGYGSIEWTVLVLIACMLAFGTAFEQSGAASAVAKWLAATLEPIGPRGLLAGFFILTVLLTQPMSNQAAALVMLPVALGVANELDLNPRPFVIAIAIAASNSFISPLEPASLLVFGPGRYTFMDFVRVGAGLTLISFALAMIVIPMVWPF